MARIEIGYDVVGIYYHTIDIGIYYHTIDTDDYLWDENTPWEEMTEEEKENFIREVALDVSWEAERDSDYILGSLCSWKDENGKTHDIS